LETKLKIHDKELGYYRGYIPLDVEKTDPVHSTDLKEAFDIGLQLNIDDPEHPGFRRLSAPNLWPENQPDFRVSVERYFQDALDFSKELFKLFALSLDLAENYFDLVTDMPIAQMRLIRYPAVKAGMISDKLGIGTHTDYECFTLLLQDDIEGLELMNASGEWIDAPPITDSMMVNIGEMMSRWTNGRYAATPHRVRNHTASDRISIPFFFATNYDTEIVCLETCCDDMNPPQFDPVMAGDYLQDRLNSIYGESPN
jgi:isopenicillin N synthase-like dioxygenase